MGKTAGELLTTRLLAPSRPAETVVLRTTLNVRASSTPMATALRASARPNRQQLSSVPISGTACHSNRISALRRAPKQEVIGMRYG